MRNEAPAEYPAMANGRDDALGLGDTRGRPSLGAYAQVAALLHESRRQAPDQLGVFLGRRVAVFGMRDLSVYVTDFEQRRLLPIVGSAATASILMDASTGGRSFTTSRQVEEPVDGGVRLWSVVVDGAARLGVMCVTVSMVDEEGRSLADSLAGVVAALLVTRGQCTDAYTSLRRSEKFSLAAEMQWDLLPPLSLDSGRVSVAGLIQPAYEVGGDSFDYAVNGDTLEFAVFDAMGHGLESSQLAHLAVSSYRHSRRSGLDLEATYLAMDTAIAARGPGDEFVTCILGRLDLVGGRLTWINAGHPLPLLVREGDVVGHMSCEPTLPAGIGHGVAGDGAIGDGVVEVAHDVLERGDRLFFLTDGVVDSHRPGGEDFGEERLIELLGARSREGLDAAETVRQLSHTVLDHHGVLSDDTTVFLVDFHTMTAEAEMTSRAPTPSTGDQDLEPGAAFDPELRPDGEPHKGEMTTSPSIGEERPEGMIPARTRRRTKLERGSMRILATGGIIGIATLLGAVLVSQDVADWIVGLAVGLTSVILAAVLWSSRQL